MKGGCTSSRKNHPLAARIKRLMQKDEEVGRIASVTPILISRALELFLRKLCTNVIEYTKSKKSRTLSPSHLKAYVFSDSNMDFLKSTVKDAPDLPSTENAAAPASSKRNRVPHGESSLGATRSRGKARGEWCPGRNSKRQCIPKVAAEHSAPIVPSAFSAMSQGGPEGASLTPNANWKLSSVHSAPVFHIETSSMNSLEQGNVSSAPATVVQPHDSPISPDSQPTDFQKALEQLSTSSSTIPTSPGHPLQMPPVSSAISISAVELGGCPKEEQTLPSINDQGPAVQFSAPLGFPTAAPSQSLKAEEDNYDFSDDEMECEEGQ